MKTLNLFLTLFTLTSIFTACEKDEVIELKQKNDELSTNVNNLQHQFDTLSLDTIINGTDTIIILNSDTIYISTHDTIYIAPDNTFIEDSLSIEINITSNTGNESVRYELIPYNFLTPPIHTFESSYSTSATQKYLLHDIKVPTT